MHFEHAVAQRVGKKSLVFADIIISFQVEY